MPRKTKTADEVDATEARRFLVWRRGELRRIKAGMRRRERREARHELRTAEQEYPKG